MAIWQVTFALVPEEHFNADGSIHDEKLICILEGKILAYVFFTLPDDYAANVGKLLALAPSAGWAEHMEHWGESRSDDFTNWHSDNDELIEIIEARIDVRKLANELLAGLLDLAERWKCVLVERSHHTICRMNANELRGLIAGHANSRATKDPGTWIPFLADEPEDGSPEL